LRNFITNQTAGQLLQPVGQLAELELELRAGHSKLRSVQKETTGGSSKSCNYKDNNIGDNEKIIRNGLIISSGKGRRSSLCKWPEESTVEQGCNCSLSMTVYGSLWKSVTVCGRQLSVASASSQFGRTARLWLTLSGAGSHRLGLPLIGRLVERQLAGHLHLPAVLRVAARLEVCWRDNWTASGAQLAQLVECGWSKVCEVDEVDKVDEKEKKKMEEKRFGWTLFVWRFGLMNWPADLSERLRLRLRLRLRVRDWDRDESARVLPWIGRPVCQT